MPNAKEKDVPFKAASKSAKAGRYLGDREVIDAMLKVAVHDVMEKLAATHSPQWERRAIQEPSREIAAILLGMRPKDFDPMPKWNEPGGIDVFLAKWCGSAEITPRRRVEHAMLNMFGELLDLAIIAGTPGVYPEQVQYGVGAVLEKYALLCLGIDLPSQAMLELET
jgi:hypothetical protein